MPKSARPAAKQDLETLVEMMREFYAESATPFDAAGAERAFAAILDDDRFGRVFVLEREGEAAGYAVLTVGFSMEFGGRDGFLDDLFVREGHRGAGLGRAALDAVMAEARDRRVLALHLEVARDNAAAKELYRKFGFRDTDRQLLTVRLGTEDPDAG